MDDCTKITDNICPVCGKRKVILPPPPAASCNCPTMIYVPPGNHIHHTCPVHGEITIHGSDITC